MMGFLLHDSHEFARLERALAHARLDVLGRMELAAAQPYGDWTTSLTAYGGNTAAFAEESLTDLVALSAELTERYARARADGLNTRVRLDGDDGPIGVFTLAELFEDNPELSRELGPLGFAFEGASVVVEGGKFASRCVAGATVRATVSCRLTFVAALYELGDALDRKRLLDAMLDRAERARLGSES